MSEIYFTSDLHMMHNKDFLFKPRGFSNERDMCEALVENWNNIVKPDDIVYDLGDIALSDIQEAAKYIKKLNGKHMWIRGNHDSDNKVDYLMDYCWDKLYFIGWADILKDGKFRFYMSHYPTLTANYSSDKHFNQNIINLHAHTHQKTNFLNPTNPFMYHVGLDSHNCTPVHIDEILSDIRQRWNELGQLPTLSKPEDLYPYGGMI